MDGALRALCGSETRFRVIRVLFDRPLEPLSLTAIADAAGSDPANTLRLLRTLVSAGLVEMVKKERAVAYRPRRGTVLFHHLFALFSAARSTQAASSLHERLDENKRRIGELILERHTIKEVRSKSLENLKRWRANGVWNEAYQEWESLVQHGSDAQLVHAMTVRDDESNRLRQSMPYVGMLDRKTIRQLNEKVTA